MNFVSLSVTLPVLLWGMGGIFVVIGLIALSVVVMNKVFNKKR